MKLSTINEEDESVELEMNESEPKNQLKKKLRLSIPREKVNDLKEKEESEIVLMSGDLKIPINEGDQDDSDEEEETPQKPKNVKKRLVFTNKAWRSAIPRAVIGLGLFIFGIFVMVIELKYWPVTVGMLMFGLVFIIKAKHIVYAFDLNKGLFVVKRTTIFKTEVKRYELSKIKNVLLHEEKDSQGGIATGLFVEMRDGQKIKIFNGQLFGSQDGAEKKACERINEFLKEYKSPPSDSIAEKFTKKVSKYILASPRKNEGKK